MRRIVSVLFWAGVLLLGAFGIYFSFTNYPWFGIGVALVSLLLIGSSERGRRKKRRASEEARSRNRALARDRLNG